MRGLAFIDGSYRSPGRRVSLPARALPSMWFYFHMLSSVMRASSLAKKGRYGNDEWAESSLEIVQALEGVGIKLEITGTDNFRRLDGPCVFISNHMSTLETFVLPVIILPSKDMTFVVKKALTRYPVFGHIMRATEAVSVTRTNPRADLRAVLEGGSGRLRAGCSMVIFPQTTRSTVFDPDDFNTIGIKLARRENVPIVPVALKSDAWGVGKYIKDFGKIDPSKKVFFSFGQPLRVKDRGAEEHRKVIEFIRGRLGEWAV